MWYAVCLGVIREDHSRAAVEVRRCQELDPLSLYIHSTAGWTLWWAREYDRAIEVAQRILDMNPAFLQAYYVLGNAFLATGRFEKAAATFQKAVEISGAAFALASLGATYARCGQTDKALSILDQLKSRSREEYVPSNCFLWIYTGLGQTDAAFEWLERMYEEKNSMLFWLKVGPIYDSLRGDPRFQDMIRRMNFPS
jgi:serine/threonine-protein kinase